MNEVNEPIRKFETGATRSPAAAKPEYHGYFSALVMERFGEYMLKHQTASDGSYRAPDNWKLGIPFDSYLASCFRHFHDFWGCAIGEPPANSQGIEEALCAVLFNAQGYLHEILKQKRSANPNT
ncbi:MAG TPA: hypothetical protein VG206_02955 [Terriglobia bacterium]|nr:hypothetical protein [Terriglobia bacterium]